MLTKLQIRNIRNIREAMINPGKNLNIIVGRNGSGKTSLLESIFLLGRGKSFRTARISEVTTKELAGFSVSGTIEDDTGICRKVVLGIKDKKKIMRIDGFEINSRLDLLYCYPLQFISPTIHSIVDGPPTNRRLFMDWGLFHSDELYPKEWKRFSRCLKHRNFLLRRGGKEDTNVWDVEFARYGTIIGDKRKAYIDELRPYLEETVEFMIPALKIEIRYSAGWNVDFGLLNDLESERTKDLKIGYTFSGPHKGDIDLNVGLRSCRTFLSRGQIKLLALSMKLAQIKFMIESNKKFCTLLIDDFCAELDRSNLKKVKQFISDLDIQCFITATDRSSIGSLCGVQSTMFHVEQGDIRYL